MYFEIPIETPGIDLRTRFDGGLFNLKRFHSRRRSQAVKIKEIQYADDNATPTHYPMDLQTSANHFSDAYTLFAMTINAVKTKTFFQLPPTTRFEIPKITIENRELEQVDQFPHLGSILSSDAKCDKDIENRIRLAHIAFGKLNNRVFNNKGLALQTKIHVYQAIVVSTLLYACETWVLYRKDLKKLERFHQSKLRFIMNVKWEDRITNNTILSRAKSNSIESIILKHRLRWVGHLARMDDNRLPRQILYSELEEGKRPKGAPKRRYKDQLKTSLKQVDIDIMSWENDAKDRSNWRTLIHEGTKTFERKRIESDERKRQIRKEKLLNPTVPTIPCLHCGRKFRATIALRSHQRKCK